MREPRIETLEHTADVGMRVEAPTAQILFEQSALGMMVMMARLEQVRPSLQRRFEISGDGYDDLLVNWLSELLYCLDGEQQIFSRFSVRTVRHDYLEADAWGETFEPARHYRGSFVKAVTYHQLKVIEDAEGWLAEVYFDI